MVRLILRGFHVFALSLFLPVHTKGAVWGGWMSLLCFFSIAWRTLSEGRQGSRVPDRLVGSIWLCYSNHKLLRLSGECFVLRFAFYFPWFLVLLVCSGAVSLACYF